MNSVLRIFKRDKLRVFLVICTSMLGNLLTLYPITRVSYIVDSIANSTLTFDDVIREIYILILIGISKYIISSISDYFTFIGYYNTMKNVSEDVQKSVYKHTPILFNRISPGELISRSTNDIVDYISPIASFGLFCFMEGVVYNSYITVLIFSKSTLIYTLLIIAPYVIQTIYLYRRKSYQEVYYDKMLKTMDKITDETLENVKGVRVIRTYNLLAKVRKSFVSKLNIYTDNNLEYMKKVKLFQPINMLSTAVSYMIAVIYGFYLIKNGEMTIGGMMSIFLVLTLIQWPYIALSQFIISFIETKKGMQRIEEIENQEVLVNNKEAKYELNFQEKIEFKDFNFKYEDKLVLKNINLTIGKGKTIGIVGKTGSGKSTLIKQLLRLYPIQNQSIFIDNKAIEEYYDYSIRNSMSVAFQEYQLFSKSLKDNILFYRENLEDKLEEALVNADLKKDVDKFTEGVDTLIGENGLSLSGGQKQRIAIARSLISNPEILILDDSLSAVDAATEKNIIENIKNERQGKTNIIVAHRVSAVRHADKIVVLSDGEIIGQGRHEELIETCDWYRELDEYQNKEAKKNEEE
ncbi:MULTISPECIES: ABC transporter ATP-binding protein [unclassified Gemella]|uniref:ABC transporter ATP-binding protein n=1 Tax=unclassified Gemella TaxID=2624949 RepID=UPI001074386D|nr:MULTISPECIES: ABC transporter ATP-binding protein [unclassified Gemella]MBF0709872.1 ABC transporter ATP-binding protein [Gemella sp. GL1.1]MBF0746824.1 ABC transporter ATP-binding protein [Gemella sp. 19428wG2_WT2a]NYS27216.1 ABC transporter ATP-binding protein [Gemella sp. GL1]TFU59549.1 ABC transporter ATP-binding protein [Gemella sp. WT2a]